MNNNQPSAQQLLTDSQYIQFCMISVHYNRSGTRSPLIRKLGASVVIGAWKRVRDVGSRKTREAMRLYDYCTFRCCIIRSFSNLLPYSRSFASLSQVVGNVHSSKIVRARWAANAPTRFSKHFEIQPQRSFASFHQYPSTIYALSTAPGRAAIAIIRISGTACLNVRTQQPNRAFVC